MVHCSLCGTPRNNKSTCRLNTKNQLGGGKGRKPEKCMNCGSEWIYKAPAGRAMLCKDCYDEMHDEVLRYHTLQDEAEKAVKAGDIPGAVTLLLEVIKLRNTNVRFFENHLGSGHDYFANTFLPALIAALKASDDPPETWNQKFRELEIDDR